MRKVENFLDSYVAYNSDGFVPDKFHLWTAVSIVAGALERKVWLPWSKVFSWYPNLYILLVSKPGIGKSSAINPGVGMLRQLSSEFGNLNLLPSQVTEARLIEMMRHHTTFEYDNNIYKHCSGYFYASEASSGLRDVYGSFIDTITSFYDCDALWEKATIGMGKDIYSLVNVCFNLLAGSTFDYLSKLITDQNIMGGFASRCTYVIQKDAVIRTSPWQNRGLKAKSAERYQELLADLFDIHNMNGPFKADEEFAVAWEKWFPEFDKQRQEMKSEKMQSLMVRKSTLVIKLSMILSACESSDRILRKSHWERAMQMSDDVEKDLPDMLREGKSRQFNDQGGANAAITKLLMGMPDNCMEIEAIVGALMLRGFGPDIIKKTLGTLQGKNDIFKMMGTKLCLFGNPDDYL